SAKQLQELGNLYAAKFQEIDLFRDATVIFGSAYKGIPIAVATAIQLATSHPTIRAVSDRKETKTHGDTGSFLGILNVGDKAVIGDDVITTGGTQLEAI